MRRERRLLLSPSIPDLSSGRSYQLSKDVDNMAEQAEKDQKQKSYYRESNSPYIDQSYERDIK